MTESALIGTPFRILGIAHEVGEEILLMQDLFPATPELGSRTGIPQVHRTRGTAYELALRATHRLLNKTHVSTDQISAVIYVTQSPEWFLPAHACRIQSDLNLTNVGLAFDVGQGCSGFVQALSLAVRLLDMHENILIINADTYRAKLNPTDRGTNAIFSDGSAATLISRNSPTHCIVGESHFTDGGGADLLEHRVDGDSPSTLSMNGREVFLFTRRVFMSQAQKACDNAGIGLTDVDFVFVHQASKLVLDSVSTEVKPFNIQCPSNLSKYGNTVSCTIPILLEDYGLLPPNEISMLSGFGVGLSCSTLVIAPFQPKK